MTGRQDHQPGHWAHRRAVATVILVTLAALTGCGLPQDSRARPVASADIPPGLLGSTTTVGVSASGQGPSRTLYFLDENAGHLVGVDRPLSDARSVTLLKAEVAGPGTDSSLGSDIPPNTQLIDVSQSADVLSVVLSDDIIKIAGSAQANAFAQLVWTATGQKGVNSVMFYVNGSDGKQQLIKPPTDSGSEHTLITQRDYQNVRPEPMTTTAATTPLASGTPPPSP
jgi:Sporulation and spore germination